MGGRGTYAFGKNVQKTYKTVGYIEDAKILEGVSLRYHSLPSEAHSSDKYIKLKPDGSFKELRVYDKDKFLILEIAYHPERNLPGEKGKEKLHYHTYDREFNRSVAKPLTDELYNKYKKYLKGVKR